MSVMQLSLNHFKAIYNKACTYPSKKILDIEYCYTLSSGISQNRLKHLIKQWAQMNYISSCRKYNKDLDGACMQEINRIIQAWDYEQIKEKPCNCYQMLKLLECLRYNISEDIFNEEEQRFYKTSLDLLERTIKSIQNAIISQISEYKEAAWSI